MFLFPCILELFKVRCTVHVHFLTVMCVYVCVCVCLGVISFSFIHTSLSCPKSGIVMSHTAPLSDLLTGLENLSQSS